MSSEVTITENAGGIIIYKRQYYKEVKKMYPGLKISDDIRSCKITLTGSNAYDAVDTLAQLASSMQPVRLFSPILEEISNYKDIMYGKKKEVIDLLRKGHLHATFDINKDHVMLYVEGLAAVQQVVQCIEKVVVEASNTFQHIITVNSPTQQYSPGGYGGDPQAVSSASYPLSPTSPTSNSSSPRYEVASVRSRHSSMCDVLPGDVQVPEGAFHFLQKAGLLTDITKMNGGMEPKLFTGKDKTGYVRLNANADYTTGAELKNRLARVASFKDMLKPKGAARVIKFHSMKSVINQKMIECSLTASWWTDDNQNLTTYAETEQAAKNAWNLIDDIIIRHLTDLSGFGCAPQALKAITPRINSTNELFLLVNDDATVILIGPETSCSIGDRLIREWLEVKSHGKRLWEAVAFPDEVGKFQYLSYNLKNVVNKNASACEVQLDWKGMLNVSGAPDDVLIFQLKLLSLVRSLDLTSDFNDVVIRFFSENGKKLNDIGKKYHAVITASGHGRKKWSVAIDLQQSVRPKTAPILKGMEFIIGGVPIKILKKDISSIRADCMMNSVGTDLNLKGQVSQALLEKVGISLTTALTNTARGNSFASGTVISTTGFGHWKQILHCVTSFETLPQMVAAALEKATTERHKTVAMPAFASGNLNSNKLEAARRVCAGIKQFSDRRPTHKLTSLMIVLRPEDRDNLRAYQRALSDYAAGIDDLVPQAQAVQINQTQSSQRSAQQPESNASLTVYFENRNVVKTVVKDLKELEKENFKSIKWSSDHSNEQGSLSKLTPREVDELNRKATENHIDWKPVRSRTDNRLKDLVLFGNKESVTHLEGDIRVLLREQKNRDVPSHWSSQDKDYVPVTLKEGTREYKEIQQKFMRTIGQGVLFTKIERIQNISLHSQFVKETNKVAERLGRSDVTDRFLWHGTKAENVEKICRNGFNRSFCGDNGVAYGQGTYFHIRANYSHKYVKPGSSRERKMLVAKIVVGDYTMGNSSMRTAPYKTGSVIDQYNTTVDKMDNPSIFVVYTDPGAYPEYVISYMCDELF